MHDHQFGAHRHVRGGVGDQLGGVFAGFTGGFQHDDAFVGEQRRAQQFGQFVDPDVAGAHLVHRNVAGAGAFSGRPQHIRDGTLDEQSLVAQHQMQCRNLLAHRLIVSRRADRPASPCQQTGQHQASSATAATAIPARNHRHRHNTTASSPAVPTATTPENPDGTGRLAAGKLAAQCAIRNSHHSSGPVNRISNCAAAGQSGHSAAAACPAP